MNKTCNFNGAIGLSTDKTCICKPGYTGELCQYCQSTDETLCMIINNEKIDGIVDPITGEGVKCSCTTLLRLHLLIFS